VRGSRPVTQIVYDREICGDLAAAARREWLVTNGLGGFASGTICGVTTRRYHALLVAALHPPAGRTVLAQAFDESVEYLGDRYDLATSRWHDGTIAPEGYRNLERFELDRSIPLWTFACADASIEKRVWMEQGANTTYVLYEVVRASAPVVLRVKALVNHRDFHATTHAGDWRMSLEPIAAGFRVIAFTGATPYSVRSDRAGCTIEHVWYRNYDLAEERTRGLDGSEDRLHAATFETLLHEGESVTFVASVEEATLDGAAALDRRREHEERLLGASGDAPPWIARLILAADQFVVRRPIESDASALSIIAGYHWFSDWSRDAMIALPGLTLSTGRAPLAAKILETFTRYCNQGMLPNYFPDAGSSPAYNSADAPLWMIEAVRQYVDATGDVALLDRLYPTILDVIRCYRDGTRFNIHRDPGDGLIYAGEDGVQVTWMDAKAGDWVVTPRIGKPVEINALWYNALRAASALGRRIGAPDDDLDTLAASALAGFQRYWSEAAEYCYDVIDGPNGNDASLRPNQIFAVSLAHSALSSDQQRFVVDACERVLLCTHGLRSLSARDPEFRRQYGGSQLERDAAYHQGTVWTWLIGSFALAHYRVYRNRAAALAILEAAGTQVTGYGIGTLAEIADGTPPFRQRGCIAQAWSVAEVLRAFSALRAER
jgi:predicted glycogen debranching enzyme